jgi:signal recognition particle receptor subunit beta
MLEDKLAGASLLIFANKQDLAGALPVDRVAQVCQRAGTACIQL